MNVVSWAAHRISPIYQYGSAWFQGASHGAKIANVASQALDLVSGRALFRMIPFRKLPVSKQIIEGCGSVAAIITKKYVHGKLSKPVEKFVHTEVEKALQANVVVSIWKRALDLIISILPMFIRKWIQANPGFQEMVKECGNKKIEQQLVGQIFPILDALICENGAKAMGNLSSAAVQSLAETYLGHKAYQYGLAALIKAGEGSRVAPLLSIVDGAYQLSLVKLMIGAAAAMGAVYVAPVVLQRLDQKVIKDELKKKLSDYLGERIWKDSPLHSQMKSLIQGISVNVADFIVESEVISTALLDEVLRIAPAK